MKDEKSTVDDSLYLINEFEPVLKIINKWTSTFIPKEATERDQGQ